MFLNCVGGGLPAVNRVARGAFSGVRTLGKLAIVGISFVAIHAPLEYQRLLKIAVSVALGTIHTGVLAFQWKLCLRVIKSLVQRLSGDLLPTAGVVAGLAGLPDEASAMRVFVTVRALGERNPCVLRLAIGSVGVTLCALHLSVEPRQWVASLRVIELSNADMFPVFKIMALLTGGTKAALVGILVTAAACG